MNCNEEIQDLDLIWIAKNSKMVHTLDLTDCTCITDKSLIEIALSCKFIEVLKLKGCGKITDQCAHALGKLNPHLRILDMENLSVRDEIFLSV
eukprot:545889-Ditylum_brightwellii.AAC.1